MQSEALRIKNGRWAKRKSAAWLAASLISVAITAVPAQSPRTPSFDVATIKPIPPDGRPTKGWVGVQYNADSVEFAYQTLRDVICNAYGYNNLRFDGQIAGLPDWATTQRFDILAKMTVADAATFATLRKDEQMHWREQAIQSLLAERFSLTDHRGTKQVPVFDLVVAKDGIKMKDAATDSTPPQLGKDEDGKPRPGVRFLKDTSIMQAYSMQSFTDLLSLPAAQLGRPVLDNTGLTGTYNFTVDWSIYSAGAAAAGEATSIFDALEKIGLKLRPSTAALPTIVVDHVEHPTAN